MKTVFGIPTKVMEAAEYLVLDLFTGMDGLGNAFDMCGISELEAHKVLVICFETDARCRKLLRARRHRPNYYVSSAIDASNTEGSVFALTDAEFFVLDWLLLSCPNIRLVLVAGGSPCVGFSSKPRRTRHR